MAVTYKTQFGSLDRYEKGGVQAIDDDVKNYAFSNCFEIASRAKPYECMDGEVEVHLIQLQAAQQVPDPEHNGAVLVEGEPKGQKMGWMKLKRGHQGLLPKNSAYQFRSAKPGVVVLQTCKGDISVERWAQICQAA